MNRTEQRELLAREIASICNAYRGLLTSSTADLECNREYKYAHSETIDKLGLGDLCVENNAFFDYETISGKSTTEIQHDANISPQVYSNYVRNVVKNIPRLKVCQLAIGLGLNYKNTKTFFTSFGFVFPTMTFPEDVLLYKMLTEPGYIDTVMSLCAHDTEDSRLVIAFLKAYDEARKHLQR